MTWVSFRCLVTIFDNDMNAVSTFMQGRTLYECRRLDRHIEDYYPLADWGVDAWWNGWGLCVGSAYVTDGPGFEVVPDEDWGRVMISLDVMDLLGV